MLAAHHLIMDLWSLALLITEFGQRYAEPAFEAPAPTLRYSDFVRWQSALLGGPDGVRLWEYWRSRLAGDRSPLQLPTDHPRPPVQTFRGAWHALQIGPALTQQLKALGERRGATLYMTLLAAFKMLLYRYTGQTDLIVGAPTTGRSRPEFADVVGYFVNSVALRTDLSGDPTFAELLARVRRTVAEALAHQDYPLALLVEKLQPQRDASRPPLFQTMFVFERSHLLQEEGFASLALGAGGQTLQLAGLPLESIQLDNPATPFDLTVVVAESERGLGASFNYNADLFEPATIARMAGHFATLLEALVAAPDLPIHALRC
jgi:non-ribosomal peptide synthetase component F